MVAKNHFTFLPLSFLGLLLFCRPPSAETLASLSPLPVLVSENRERMALGERLFNDRRLSGQGTRSCATCHPLDQGTMDGQVRAESTDGVSVLRNTPTLFNVAFNYIYNWDGVVTTLEAHLEKVLGRPVDTLVSVVLEKQEQAEYFKSDNALLRNSVMYVDLVGKSLGSRTKTGATAVVGDLWQALLSFMETPEPNLAQEIQEALDHLAKVRPLPKDYQALILHGRLIVDGLPKLDALLHKIIGYAIAARIDGLQMALSNYSGEIETRAQLYRLLLYLVAVVLVAYLIYQFAQLRKNTQALRHAHANLQKETGERLQAEIALRDSEQRLRAISDSAHEAIVSVDSLGNIVSWNRGHQ